MSITTVSIPDGNDEDLLTLSEVAVILKKPVNTMYWWRQQGTGPQFFKLGRNLVTTTGELKRWLREQKQRGRLHNG